MRLSTARRIAFVEDEIDDDEDGCEALGSLRRARRTERNIRVGDSVFRPRDSLLHRALADDECARDLRDRESRDDTKRERDLLRGWKLRMAADEEQPENVVPVMRTVEALGDLFLGVFEIRNRFFG